MWSSISSYLIGFSADHPEEEISDSDESDWVFVSPSGEEVSKKDAFVLEAKVEDFEDKRKSRSATASATLHINVKNSLCTPQISPSVSPSRMDGSWFITPPPCFTVQCSSEIEKSPLEDLLIEHPSMSVYYGYHQSQFSPHPVMSTDEHLFEPHLQDLFPLPVHQELCAITKENRSCDAFVPDHILPCVTSRDKNYHQLIVNQEWQGKQCNSSVKKVNFNDKPVKILSSLENCVIVVHRGKLHEKPKPSVPKKQLLPKKGDKKVTTRPSNLVQWSYERGNLRSSYITRQNRVQQMRNPFCQRNSRVVKPFGEKCKHHI